MILFNIITYISQFYTTLHITAVGGTAVESTVPMAQRHLGKKKRETEIREYSDTVVAHDKGTQQLV